jgi:hypothetical protein
MPIATLVTPILLALLTLAAPAPKSAPAGPHIAGTYQLVKRVLPDGKELTAPDVQGMMTFTSKYRNFNVSWKEADGKQVSISYIAEYQLTNDQYCEHPLYWMQSNLGEPGIKYDVPANKSDCSKVTHDGRKFSFQISGEPPVVTFEGETLTAVAKDTFVDHWIRVK